MLNETYGISPTHIICKLTTRYCLAYTASLVLCLIQSVLKTYCNKTCAFAFAMAFEKVKIIDIQKQY